MHTAERHVPETEASTRDRVLELVVEQGPVSAATLARVLELTPAAVRRHIAHLEEVGQIVVHEPGGPGVRRRGRPARHYVATDAGRSVLTDAYSDLATHALDFLRQVAGPGALDAFAEARVTELERRYRPLVEQAGRSLPDRVHALAGALTADGYAATTRTVGAQGLALQLCQGHCPVQDVAEGFPQLCEAETQAFSRLLGVHVQRLATLAAGGHVCTTHVPLAVAPAEIPVRHGAAGPGSRLAQTPSTSSQTTTSPAGGVTEGN